MSAWRLLLTRPADECVVQAEALAGQGIASSCMPLLDIEPIAPSREQAACMAGLARYCAVIVVSKPAARLGLALLDEHWAQAPQGLPWFSVGAATASLLAAHGLDVHFPAGGDDSEALLALPRLQQALAEAQAPRVLIVRGEEGRELLAERLRAQGAVVDYLPLYRRKMPPYAAGELIARVQAERLNALVVSSGQGFEHLVRLAGDDWPSLARLPLFVPSPRVAEQARLAGGEIVVDCRGASTAALLAALERFPAAAP